MQHTKTLFLVTFLGAIFLRIVLLLWSLTYPFDINGDQTRYEGWAQIAHIHSFQKTYTEVYPDLIPNNMPPGTLYVMYGTYELYTVVGKVINTLTGDGPGENIWVNTTLLHGVMRVPSMLADIGMGLLLFFLVAKEKGEKRGVLAASLVWFNPVIWYNSTWWGQTDALTSFFVMLAIFLTFKRWYILSLIAFVLSVYIKFSLLPLLPFFLFFVYFYSGKKWKALLLGGIVSVSVLFLLTLLISANPVGWFIEKLPMFSKGETQNITVYAFNFWWAVTCFPTVCKNTIQSYDTFLTVPYSYWAYGLFVSSIIPIIYFQINKPDRSIKKQYAFWVFSLVMLCVFLFLPRMHERYLYPFFPLFAGVIALSKHPRHSLVIFGLLVLLHMGNIIASYYPTRFFSLWFSDMIYGLPYRWIISVLIVSVGGFLYWKGLQEFFERRTTHAKQAK